MPRTKSCDFWVMELCHNIFVYIKSNHFKFGDQSIARVDVIDISRALIMAESRAAGTPP